jgi:hypothetical protein
MVLRRPLQQVSRQACGIGRTPDYYHSVRSKENREVKLGEHQTFGIRKTMPSMNGCSPSATKKMPTFGAALFRAVGYSLCFFSSNNRPSAQLWVYVPGMKSFSVGIVSPQRQQKPMLLCSEENH